MAFLADEVRPVRSVLSGLRSAKQRHRQQLIGAASESRSSCLGRRTKRPCSSPWRRRPHALDGRRSLRQAESGHMSSCEPRVEAPGAGRVPLPLAARQRQLPQRAARQKRRRAHQPVVGGAPLPSLPLSRTARRLESMRTSRHHVGGRRRRRRRKGEEADPRADTSQRTTRLGAKHKQHELREFTARRALSRPS